MDRIVYDRMSELEAEHWWFAARREIIRRTIACFGNLPATPELLEAGCGTGNQAVAAGGATRSDCDGR